MLEERMRPIQSLLQSAIEKVAAENSYDYVLDFGEQYNNSISIVNYAFDDQSYIRRTR